jgi:hypothetical protein
VALVLGAWGDMQFIISPFQGMARSLTPQGYIGPSTTCPCTSGEAQIAEQLPRKPRPLCLNGPLRTLTTLSFPSSSSTSASTSTSGAISNPPSTGIATTTDTNHRPSLGARVSGSGLNGVNGTRSLRGGCQEGRYLKVWLSGVNPRPLVVHVYSPRPLFAARFSPYNTHVSATFAFTLYHIIPIFLHP